MYNNKSETKSGFKLMSYHYRAVELRYSGTIHKEIAEILRGEFGKNFSDSKVRHWFAGGGLLETYFLDYSRKENERRRNEVIERMKTILPKIPEKFEQLLDRVMVAPFTGEKIIDKETNKPVPQLDSVTINTLKTLCDILGFKITDEGTVEDPLDRYFDRAEQEIEAKKDGNKGTDKPA